MNRGLLSFFVSLAVVSLASVTTAQESCSIADVLFIMDESSSIWPIPFKQQKTFIKDLIDMFEIGEELTRVGLVRFSTQGRMEFPMKAYQDKQSLFGAVDRIVQRGGNTNTGDALRIAREQGLTAASGARPGNPNIPQIIIVITDGNSQETQQTKDQAAETRATGATIFAIGVGKDISQQELTNIASGPEFVFHVKSYDALDSIKDQLGQKACNIAPTLPPENILQGCQAKKMDVAIVLDKSSSVAEENFEEMKGLAQGMLYSFSLGPEATRVSLLSYSDSSKIHNYFPTGTDRNALFAELGEAKQSPGKSNTISAFKSLRSVFNKKYGGRNKVAKVALFITNTKSADAGVTAAEAQNLRDQYGVEIITVAAGSQVNEAEWQNIAGRDNVIREESYKDLRGQRGEVAQKVCPIQPPPQDFGCGEKNPADIAFALDTLNAGMNGLSSVNSFIKEVSSKFEIAPDKIQVSVIENKCHKLNGFDLNTYGTKQEVLDALNLDIRSDAAGVINKLVTETFTAAKGARDKSSTKRFAILFMDGTPGNQAEVEAAAERARSEGIEIMVVGIGGKVSRAAMERIASSPKHVFTVKSYEELAGNSGLSGRISDRICKMLQ